MRSQSQPSFSNASTLGWEQVCLWRPGVNNNSLFTLISTCLRLCWTLRQQNKTMATVGFLLPFSKFPVSTKRFFFNKWKTKLCYRCKQIQRRNRGASTGGLRMIRSCRDMKPSSSPHRLRTWPSRKGGVEPERRRLSVMDAALLTLQHLRLN